MGHSSGFSDNQWSIFPFFQEKRPHRMCAWLCFKVYSGFREQEATVAEAPTRTWQLKQWLFREQAITHKNKLITFIFPWPFHSHKPMWNIPTTVTACEELRSAAVLKHRLRNTWVSLRVPQGQTEALTSSRGELTVDPIQSVIIAGITKSSGLSVLLFFTSNKFH